MKSFRPRSGLGVALPLCLVGFLASGCAVQNMTMAPQTANLSTTMAPQTANLSATANQSTECKATGEGRAASVAGEQVEPGARAGGGVAQVATGGGLVGYWRFDEGAGNTAADGSGNGNHGALIDGGRWSTDRAPVASDFYAIGFDDRRSYVRVAASSSLTIGSTLTVSAWIKAPDPSNGGTGETTGVVSQPRPDGGTGYRLGVEGGRANFGMNNGSSWNCSLASKSMLVAGRWTQITGTYDGDTMTVYVDGVAQGTSACASGPLQPSHQAIQIGREFEILGGRYFSGLIDEARIYDTTLGAAEVRALFEGGRG